MTDETQNPESVSIPKAKSPRRKGPIRTEAVLPFLIITALTYMYFSFFFDSNLRTALEYIGYEVIGAEVNIQKLETSFIHGSVHLHGLEITNPENPKLDMLKLGDIRFGLLWEGLFKARFVIEEMAVEQIEISVPRQSAGRVKPIDPPSQAPKSGANSSSESLVEKESLKAGKQALKLTANKYQGNILGDIAGFLNSNSSSDDQLKNVEQNLPSKKKLDEFSAELSTKQKAWDEKLKMLPQNKEIEQLGQRLSAVKTSNFKNPQELVESLQKIGEVLKEADSKYKSVSQIAGDLTTDLNNTNNQFKSINEMINQDIANLQSKMHIPNIDGKTLSTGILQSYLAPYLKKMGWAKSAFDKYSPLNAKAKSKDKQDTQIAFKAHPRAKGVTYEFGRPNSYPMFWIKKISISSKASSVSPLIGDMSGKITDISSNQSLSGRPTIGDLQGNFPGLNVSEVRARISFDDRKDQSLLDLDFAVGSYPIEGREVISSDAAKIAFKKASGTLKSHAEIMGFKEIEFNLANQVSQIDYDISAQNSVMDDILKNVFKGIPKIEIEAKGKGELPDPSIDINSNIGPELQKGFQAQLNQKIEAAKAKLQAAINQAIGGEKSKIEGQLNQARSQVDGQVKKVQEALNQQKSKAEKETTQAQKSSTGDVQKKLEDLKKSLGF